MSAMRRGLTLSLCLLFLHVINVHARTWTSTDLPSPQNDPKGVCARGTVKSAVCDPDGFLSQSDADTIDGLINFINKGSNGFKKLPCKHSDAGAQIAVAVIESMPHGSGDKEARAFQYAKDLHDRWGIGDSQCQNGVLLFFAVKDRAMAFSVGAGAKKVFTDAMGPSVMSVMRDKLRKEEYGQAIVDGVTAIGNILSTGKAPVVKETDDAPSSLGFFAFLLGVLGMSAFVSSRKKRRYARCKKLLEKIDTDRAAASSQEYVSKSCPICLEDFDQGKDSPGDGGIGIAHPSASERPTVRTRQAGRGASSTATVHSTEGSGGPAKALPCGHKFHGSCILSWVSGMGASNQLCPICRQPITEDGESRVSNMTNSGQPSGWDVYDSEYSFRMRRTQFFYPDFITWNMINTWEAERFRDSHCLANSGPFTAVDPAAVAAAARTSGAGGSSFSFGGGSSGGGGGGGGSW